eukprot:2925424-Prorocentrum_lima.AAC.1
MPPLQGPVPRRNSPATTASHMREGHGGVHHSPTPHPAERPLQHGRYCLSLIHISEPTRLDVI